jgi:hypothetical protein
MLGTILGAVYIVLLLTAMVLIDRHQKKKVNRQIKEHLEEIEK